MSRSQNGASQPAVPPAAPNHPAPVSGEAALIAYQAYQQTMRQFLSLQEKVMQQFLSAGQMGQLVPPPSAATPTPMMAPAQPSLSNGKDNGNGAGRTSAHVPMYQPALSNGKDNGNGNGVVTTPVQVPSSNGTHTPKPVTLPEVTVTPIVEPVLPSPSPTTSHFSLPDRASLIQILLQLVSDRTGYPTEMLGLDQDMEAELGIDSIKRVEILGALQKKLPSSLAASVQSKMESLTRVKSLNGIVEQLLSNLPTVTPTPVVTSQPAGVVGSQLIAPLPDKGSLTQTLLRLVSDRTGYPSEMLGLDQDMEAELGIDSIKRVEILGALQKTLPQPLAAGVQSKMESLTRVKSLNGIVEQLLLLPSTTPVGQEENGLGKLTNGRSPLDAT
jgi:acyl carrier protein